MTRMRSMRKLPPDAKEGVHRDGKIAVHPCERPGESVTGHVEARARPKGGEEVEVADISDCERADASEVRRAGVRLVGEPLRREKVRILLNELGARIDLVLLRRLPGAFEEVAVARS